MVVASVPSPVIYVATSASDPAIEAVGVPEFTPVNANLAESVELLPSSRSCVVFLSKIL